MKQLLEWYSNTSSFIRSLISAIIGFIFYGGWAYFVHFDYGVVIAAKAFLTQGLISFSITLVLTHFMEKIYHWITMPRLAYWFTAISATIFVAFISCSINMLVGTPETLLTVLPGIVVSAVYSFSYTKALSAIRKRRTQAAT